jgi:antitoxin HicB
MARLFKVPLVLSTNPAGGYRVTSPLLPELLTEAGTPDEAVRQVAAALLAVFELYEYARKPFPAIQCVQTDGRPVAFEGVIIRP